MALIDDIATLGGGSGFNNSIIAGQGTLIRTMIQSPNYVPGVSGWTINKDGSAEFNNMTIRGKFSGTNFEINSNGAFFYSGVPATGNLLATITPAAGTDPFNNPYKQSVTSYGVAESFVNLLNNQITIGTSPSDSGGHIVGGAGQINYTSGLGGVGDTQAGLVLISKNNTIAGLNPQALIGPGNSPSAITSEQLEVQGNVAIQGAAISIVSGAEETWHNLTSFAAGWSVGGFAKYRMLPSNAVRLAFQDLVPDGTATNKPDNSTILSIANGLPPAYRPATNHRIACYCDVLRSNPTNEEAAALQFNSDGSIACFGIAASSSRVDLYADMPIDI